MTRVERLRQVEVWIAWVRILAVAWRSKPGAGLGLFIARSIAEAHGGTLELDSEPGAGAAFTARLPVAP